MQTISIKKEAQDLLKYLPEDATWDDLMYKIYVRQAIEAGLEDSKAGRTVDGRRQQGHILNIKY